MNNVQRGSILLTSEARKKAVNDIVAYFLDERDEEMGIIGATNLLDFFEQEIGPSIYNVAVDDMRTALKKELEEWDYKFSELRK